MGVVDEPVEDGVGDGGVAEGFMSLLDRHLAGDDGRAALRAVLDDLEQVGRLLVLDDETLSLKALTVG